MSRQLTKLDYLRSCWQKMHIRCYDSKYHSYHRYGGRGIKVCERWHDWNLYRSDMESTYFVGATMERRDNNGDYNADNCVWAPKGANTKPLKYDLQEMLSLYRSGMTQAAVGAEFGLTQDRVSKLLARARRDETS